MYACFFTLAPSSTAAVGSSAGFCTSSAAATVEYTLNTAKEMNICGERTKTD